MAGGDELTRRREAGDLDDEAFPDGSVAIPPTLPGERRGAYRVERRDGSARGSACVTNVSTRTTPLEKRQRLPRPRRRACAPQTARAGAPGPARSSPPRGCRRRPVPARRLRARLLCTTACTASGRWSTTRKSGSRVAGGHQTSAPEPVVAGATQLQNRRVPLRRALGDDLSGSGDGFFSERLVAHWSAPIELCLCAARACAARVPRHLLPGELLRRLGPVRPEGYGALSLRPHDQTARAREVRTWRAGGTIRDRIATHYVGGAPEIGNLSYVAAPAFANATRVHKKALRLGFEADASGVIAVRAHAMTRGPRRLPGRKGTGRAARRAYEGRGSVRRARRARPDIAGGRRRRGRRRRKRRVRTGRRAAIPTRRRMVGRARARAHRGGEGAGSTRPDVSARATLIARGAGAPQAPAAVPAGAARVADFDFARAETRSTLGDDAASNDA